MLNFRNGVPCATLAQEAANFCLANWHRKYSAWEAPDNAAYIGAGAPLSRKNYDAPPGVFSDRNSYEECLNLLPSTTISLLAFVHAPLHRAMASSNCTSKEVAPYFLYRETFERRVHPYRLLWPFSLTSYQRSSPYSLVVWKGHILRLQ
jgi:hypothetical protein